MTLVLIRQIEGLTEIDVTYLSNYYPRDVNDGSKLFFIISRVFNDQRQPIQISFDTPFEREVKVHKYGYQPDRYFLIIGDIVEQKHIAKNYYVEIILRYIISKEKIKMIFPGETRFDSIENIPTSGSNDVASILTQLEPHETATKLASLNYPNISVDLIQSVKRFQSGDFEGSIKFSRKVVEGIRQLKIEEIVNESNRQEKFKAYLNGSFNLLSTYGEHTGTSASEDEALLSKDIAFGLSAYLVSKKVTK